MRSLCHALLLLCSLALSAEEETLISFDQAADIMEAYCLDCHDRDTAEGDVILDGIYDSDGRVTPHGYKLWERARYSVESGEMPPRKRKKQPNPEERADLAAWIAAALQRSAQENAGDPGMVTMRRLTNAEYKHSVRELTGLWQDWAEGFVPDGGGGEGFSNTGDVLFVSPEQLEKYLARARKIASHAELLPETGITFQKEVVGERSKDLAKDKVEQTLRKWIRKEAGERLPQEGEDLREADYLFACWQWHHREQLGTESLQKLAEEYQLDPTFLANWYTVLTEPQPESRYLALTTDAFAALSPPLVETEDPVPPTLGQEIHAIAEQRRSWYTQKDWDWASPQRLQQDVDGLNQFATEVKLKPGDKQVHLLVSDVGDGNAGDIVYWSDLYFQWPDGKWDNLFNWMWRTKEAGDEEVKKWLGPYSLLERTHPSGREMAKQTFAVQAPSIVSFPVPEGTVAFKAKGKLEQDAPEREKASAQWALVAGEQPEAVPAIIPGALTIWHRLSPAHTALMDEFSVMKKRFPNNPGKRLDQVEWNLYRWQNTIEGVYYFTNDQLLERIPDEGTRWWYRNSRSDLGFLAYKNMPERVDKQWDDKLIGHLRAFACRAWSRPASDEEAAAMRKIYTQCRSQEMTREAAAREALVSILVSPNFLFRAEQGSSEHTQTAISHYEYAARLSYLLWSTPPDAALTKSAREGKLLGDWRTICDHVDRMLADYRSFALAQEFGGQWLGFYHLHQLNTIDRERFPEFTWQLKHLMHEEAWRFFAKLIQESRPITDVTQASYTYLNEKLAAHYGIDGVTGDEFRYIDVAAQRRGGIFGMAGFHAQTSYPVRTSPVLRGDWVLREVLGRPTPPPPDNIPELEEAAEGETPLTLREQLERHREDAACASCHDRIDPLGFALEKFDPIGRWRDTDAHGQPIDDRGQTSDGMELVGIDGLKDWMKKEEDQFLHHFCTKLAGYALGREIGASDQLLIQEMIANLKKWNYSMGAAVKPLVLSRQFSHRRNHE